MSNVYANKSTASRELGKLGIPREARAPLIKGEVAPFEIDQKELKKVLKALKQPKAQVKENVIAAIAEQAVFDKADAANAPAAAAKPELSDAEWEAEQRKELEALPVAAPVASKAVKRSNLAKQNGKTRPGRGVCAAIWDELDKFVADLSGTVPTPAQAQQLGVANNWHKVTVYRQYNDWKIFHGYRVVED